MTGLTIVVAFYRNADLVKPLVDSLAQCEKELGELMATIVAVNDSPDDELLKRALEAAAEQLTGRVPFTVIANDRNLGFIRSANEGLKRAAEAGHDAILLNSDTVVFPGSIREMVRVATLDPMIGFVSPRSNNATIASLPFQEEYRHQSPQRSFEAFQQLHRHLPPYHYAPTAIGFCLLITNLMLREFGFLDEAYDAGYNEENDLIMRANRCGFRAVLANHAFVYHRGEASFGTSGRAALEQTNARRLAERYPEYPRSVQAYESGPRHQAERMLSSLLPDGDGRRDLVFDFSDVGSYHNGTIEAAKALLREFASRYHDRFNLFVIIHASHAVFHGLDKLSNIQVLPVETDRKFAVGLRIGQPFTSESFQRLNALAVRVAWFMLDTIAWDCLYLNNPELDGVWRSVFAHGDAIIYNSAFTRRQFAARFPAHAAMRHLVSYHSLDTREYLPAGRTPGLTGDEILVIGNKFAHKYVRPTIDELVRVLPEERFTCLGIERHPHRHVTCYPSGHLDDDRMESLYERTRLVVFPSMYEGFGFPLLKGLAYKKPVLMRDSALSQELRAELGNNPNIILYRDTDALVALLAAGGPTWQTVSEAAASRRWGCSADEICSLLTDLLAEPDAFDPLMTRLSLPSSHPPTGTSPLPSWLQRLRSHVRRLPVLSAMTRPLWRWVWKNVYADS